MNGTVPVPLPRLLAAPIARALSSFPVTVITGARQTGKSTLVQGLDRPATRAYLTLDELEVLEQVQQDPRGLLQSADWLTLDEVQRSPDLLLAVKQAVDTRRVLGRFLLTGSANLLLMRRISESLAGRAVHLTLWPFTRREQLGFGTAGAWSRLFSAEDGAWPELLEVESAPEEDWRELARRGGYPTPAYELQDPEARSLWFSGYTRTYLERDLQELSNVASLVDFRRLMRAACLRLGGLVNQSELARDVGLSQPTVHRHLDLLEATYQLIRLQAYAVNRTKRLIKSPKLYWGDVGLALYLGGEAEPRGAHLENLVLSDLLAWRDSTVDAPEVLYWRTAAGEEVDFVVEWRGRLLPVEVKATARPRIADAASLRSFREEYADLARPGLLLHTGTETSWVAPGVLAVPWWRVI